jgi:hypothetical protein
MFVHYRSVGIARPGGNTNQGWPRPAGATQTRSASLRVKGQHQIRRQRRAWLAAEKGEPDTFDRAVAEFGKA